MKRNEDKPALCVDFPWNQKNLDYEIETFFFSFCFCLFAGYFLEIKRTSITRLKHDINFRGTESFTQSWNQKNLDYEIETETWKVDDCSPITLKSKEPRLRDWNGQKGLTYKRVEVTWNQKNLDYEIETEFDTHYVHSCKSHSWNQKNLDYEIETAMTPIAPLR